MQDNRKLYTICPSILVDRFIRTTVLTQDEWLSALKLATMWGMADVRRTSITEITQLRSMEDVDKVVLGREYSVVNWVISGYMGLTSRSGAVSIDDVPRLTLPTCLQLWEVQVSYLDARLRRARSRSFNALEDSLGSLLAPLFNSELVEIRERGLLYGDEVQALVWTTQCIR